MHTHFFHAKAWHEIFRVIFKRSQNERVLGRKYIPTEQGNHTGRRGSSHRKPPQTPIETGIAPESSRPVGMWDHEAPIQKPIAQSIRLPLPLTHLTPLKQPNLCHYFHVEHKSSQTCILPVSEREPCPQTAALCSRVPSFGFLALLIFLLK